MYSGEDVRQRQLPSGAQRVCDEHTLCVKCVPKSMTSEDVRNLFSPYGEIVSCRILENEGGSSTNTVLVGMRSTDACNAAISGLDGREIGNGYRVSVELKKIFRSGGDVIAGPSLHSGIPTTESPVITASSTHPATEYPRVEHSYNPGDDGRENQYHPETEPKSDRSVVERRGQSQRETLGASEIVGKRRGRGSRGGSRGGTGHGGRGTGSSDNSDTQKNTQSADLKKYNVWYRHSGQPVVDGFPIDRRKRWMKTQSQIQRDIGDNYITHLRIQGDIPDRLSELTPRLEQLGLLKIPDIKQLDRLADLQSLQVLVLGDNKLSSGVPPAVNGKLTNLRELDLSDCGLTDLHEGLADLQSLQVLNLSSNKFSSGVAPAVIGKLTNLRELDLSDCGLTDLHEGLADLQSLQVLELGLNKLSSGVTPAVIWKLTNLRELNLQDCGLTDLHEGLAELQSLQVLDLSSNKFSSGVAPAVILKLTNLRELRLSNCGLTDLHEGISQLQHLEKLDLRFNSLEKLPQCVTSLTTLQELDLSDNRSLHTLSPNLMKLPNLKKLDCEDCESLKSPRYAVCRQGLDVIRRYYIDLAKKRGKPLPIASAAIFGNRMAGKTSLTHSLIEQKHKLTYRDVTAEIVHKGLSLDDKEKTVLKEYMTRLDNSRQSKEAYIHEDGLADKLLAEVSLQNMTDHLVKEAITVYQAAKTLPGVCYATRLVAIGEFDQRGGELKLDHCDEVKMVIPKDALEQMQLVYFAIDLGHDGDEEENRTPTMSPVFLCGPPGLHFREGHPVVLTFPHAAVDMDVCALSKDDSSPTWNGDGATIKSVTQAMATLEIKHFTRDKLSFYEGDLPRLKRSRIPLRDEATSCGEPGKRLSIASFSSSSAVRLYAVTRVSTNILEQAVDYYETTRECHRNQQSWAQVTFRCGKGELIVDATKDDQPYKTDRLPNKRMMEQQIEQIEYPRLQPSTRLVLNVHQEDNCDWNLNLQADTMTNEGTQNIQMRHDETFNVRTLQPQNIGESLEVTTFAVEETTTCTCDQYGGIHAPSCPEFGRPIAPISLVMSRTSEPANIATLSQPFSRVMISTGDRLCIPQQASSVAVDDEAVTQAVGVAPLVDDRCIEEIVTIMRDREACIDLHPSPVTDSSHPTTVQYKMTETRGRALILSNKYEAIDQSGDKTWRAGSEHDHLNMMLMLERFGFVVKGEHRNYTAQEFVEAIHQETQMVDSRGESIHKGLGMFVLVITSHGVENCVLGSDKVRIKISDIYSLLSTKHFPEMRGKPKVIFLQACAGGDRDMMLDDSCILDTGHVAPQAGHMTMQPVNLSASLLDDSHDENPSDVSPERLTTHAEEPLQDDGNSEDLSTADIFMMQASSDSKKSFRSPTTGSIFIRALVATFYKHAHDHDIETLAGIVRDAVNRYSIERTEFYQRNPEYAGKSHVAQMPKQECYFTNRRKLYLNPGVDMRTHNHPHYIINPVYPTQTQTRIKWLTDEEITQTRDVFTTTYKTKRWQIETAISPGDNFTTRHSTASPIFQRCLRPPTSTAGTTAQRVLCQSSSTHVCRYKEYTLSRDNLDTLLPGRWLDDQIIDTYLAMVADATSHVCALSTYAYVMIDRHGMARARSEYASALRHPEHKLILMPIHEPGHWTLVVVSRTHRTIMYYNSLLSSNDNVLRTLQLFFEDMYGGVWKTSTAQNIPKQTDGSDCGVFVCGFAELISRGQALHSRQVLVVQACQMYRTSGSSLPAEPQAGPSTAIDAKGTSPPEQTRIDMKRPHSVMMLATVPGGAAVRGAFTGALADEICKADG